MFTLQYTIQPSEQNRVRRASGTPRDSTLHQVSVYGKVCSTRCALAALFCTRNYSVY